MVSYRHLEIIALINGDRSRNLSPEGITFAGGDSFRGSLDGGRSSRGSVAGRGRITPNLVRNGHTGQRENSKCTGSEVGYGEIGRHKLGRTGRSQYAYFGVCAANRALCFPGEHGIVAGLDARHLGSSGTFANAELEA